MICDSGLIHATPITGYYWLDALFWVLGGGTVGYILGKTEAAIYRKVHHP